MHRGPRERLTGALVHFPVQLALESLGLLSMKSLEVLVPSRSFEAGKSLGYLIDRGIVAPHCFL
jgi:hypothetical protein